MSNDPYSFVAGVEVESCYTTLVSHHPSDYEQEVMRKEYAERNSAQFCRITRLQATPFSDNVQSPALSLFRFDILEPRQTARYIVTGHRTTKRANYNFDAGWLTLTFVISLYSSLSTVSSMISQIAVCVKSNVRRQELRIILARHLPLEILGRKVILVALRRLGCQLLCLLSQQLERIVLGHSLALSG